MVGNVFAGNIYLQVTHRVRVGLVELKLDCYAKSKLAYSLTHKNLLFHQFNNNFQLISFTKFEDHNVGNNHPKIGFGKFLREAHVVVGSQASDSVSSAQRNLQTLWEITYRGFFIE